MHIYTSSETGLACSRDSPEMTLERHMNLACGGAASKYRAANALCFPVSQRSILDLRSDLPRLRSAHWSAFALEMLGLNLTALSALLVA